MPGAVAMENGIQNGMPGGDHDAGARPPRMNDLPDEIQHITQGYIPLGLLLSRLAQRSHNQLTAKILELAKMQVSAPAVNGNSAPAVSLPDDNSVENLTKKANLLNFIQDLHARWTKALVIASWSRKAPTVSKLIDLMNYINMERKAFDDGLGYMANIKRDLTFARLPNPDLQTALQVLSTGSASWMPDLGYIEPPPLTAEEQLQWIEELNTLLSLRLNLEDHDKIPLQFRDYTIESGRVTFKVEGEFEVDLTIADEDFEAQFWFLDFRFAFTPAPAELTETLRVFLEARVNEALEKEGLRGCYNFLHEFVLTHKISEYVRQARELAKASWVDTLKIERLNRSMAIQYWTNRYPPDSPKSWIIIGVHSGRKPGAANLENDATSYLSLRWFRDGKEVQESNITFEKSQISTEKLLKKVIARHVEHILSTIHAKLSTKDRYLKREAALSLEISQDEPLESSLRVQVGQKDSVNLRVAPITGSFSMTPQRNATFRGEQRLNTQAKDTTEEGILALEVARYAWVAEEMNRRGRSMGWGSARSPVRPEEIRNILKSKEASQNLWFKRKGWPAQWYMMLSLSLAGDRWWMMEVANPPTGPRIANFAQLPLVTPLPALNDSFFAGITTFSAAMMAHVINSKELHRRHIKYREDQKMSLPQTPNMKLPVIKVRLSEILAGGSVEAGKAVTWAHDYVYIRFMRIENTRRTRKELQQGEDSTPKQQTLSIIADARFRVIDPAKFGLLQGNVEQDVAYNTQLGVFGLQLKAELGSTIIGDLAKRIHAIGRLVDCVDAIRRSTSDIKCDNITLAQVDFTYSDAIGRSVGNAAEANIRRWKASLDLGSNQIKMSLEKGNPHLRVLDGLNHLINSSLGFSKLPQYLAFTLPAIKALDQIEDSWAQVPQGRAEIFSEHLDWYTVRYILAGPNKAVPRVFRIAVKLRERRGSPFWHVTRCETGPNSNPDDDFKVQLAKVWGQANAGWQNFGDSASCNADDSIIGLLKAVDEAAKDFAKKPVPTSPVASRQPAKTQPTPKMSAASKPNNQKNTAAQANRARPMQAQSGSTSNTAITLD
ncbi:mediator complex subunit [Neopestalotiopsis sp. 37M]|nr:mediator complex subunit [Neopestalotiopsis sp. 37M]